MSGRTEVPKTSRFDPDTMLEGADKVMEEGGPDSAMPEMGPPPWVGVKDWVVETWGKRGEIGRGLEKALVDLLDDGWNRLPRGLRTGVDRFMKGELAGDSENLKKRLTGWFKTDAEWIERTAYLEIPLRGGVRIKLYDGGFGVFSRKETARKKAIEAWQKALEKDIKITRTYLPLVPVFLPTAAPAMILYSGIAGATWLGESTHRLVKSLKENEDFSRYKREFFLGCGLGTMAPIFSQLLIEGAVRVADVMIPGSRYGRAAAILARPYINGLVFSQAVGLLTERLGAEAMEESGLGEKGIRASKNWFNFGMMAGTTVGIIGGQVLRNVLGNLEDQARKMAARETEAVKPEPTTTPTPAETPRLSAPTEVPLAPTTEPATPEAGRVVIESWDLNGDGVSDLFADDLNGDGIPDQVRYLPEASVLDIRDLDGDKIPDMVAIGEAPKGALNEGERLWLDLDKLGEKRLFYDEQGVGVVGRDMNGNGRFDAGDLFKKNETPDGQPIFDVLRAEGGAGSPAPLREGPVNVGYNLDGQEAFRDWDGDGKYEEQRIGNDWYVDLNGDEIINPDQDGLVLTRDNGRPIEAVRSDGKVFEVKEGGVWGEKVVEPLAKEEAPKAEGSKLSEEQQLTLKDGRPLKLGPKGGVDGLIQEKLFNEHRGDPEWPAERIAVQAHRQYVNEIKPNLKPEIPMDKGAPVVNVKENLEGFLARAVGGK